MHSVSDLDLLTASYTSSVVSVRRNNGANSFVNTQEVSLGFRGPSSLELADIDGDLDIVTTNQNTRSLGIRLNDGTGAFYGTQEIALTNQIPNSLALGDFDGDGDLDVVTAQAANSTVSVRFNQNLLRTPENPASTVAGLNYQYYEGDNLAQLPPFATLTPRLTGAVTDFDVVSMRQRNYAYALRFTGYVTVPTDGLYTFYTNSDDGSQLFIGSQLVVDNDGQHSSQERSGSIGLQAGTHALTVTYFQSGGGTQLEVRYRGPNGVMQLIPAASLRRISGSGISARASGNANAEAAALQVYPNPSHGAFTVNYTATEAQSATLSLTDRLGRVMTEQTVQLQAGDNQLPVQSQGLGQGLYQLTLRPALSRPISQKVVVQP